MAHYQEANGSACYITSLECIFGQISVYTSPVRDILKKI